VTEFGFRQQIITSLALIPATFALWYAAGAPLAAPASWLAERLMTWILGEVVLGSQLQDTIWMVISAFGEENGVILFPAPSGENLAIQIDTRLVSYSVPFYAALLWGSRVSEPVLKFCIGLAVLWLVMALSLIGVAAKDLMLLAGSQFLERPGVPPADVIAVWYQFSVLLAPTLAPVILWLWQLRGTPLWQLLSRQLEAASRSST